MVAGRLSSDTWSLIAGGLITAIIFEAKEYKCTPTVDIGTISRLEGLLPQIAFCEVEVSLRSMFLCFLFFVNLICITYCTKHL